MDKWEKTPHLILRQLGKQPVFKVQEVGAKDEEQIRVLHRNMILPLQSSQNKTNVIDTDDNKHGKP